MLFKRFAAVSSTMDNATNGLFYSDTEMEYLLDIKTEFERDFPVGAVFSTRRQLIDAMREKASKFGFFVIDRGFSVL